jgi:hypothetical protein
MVPGVIARHSASLAGFPDRDRPSDLEPEIRYISEGWGHERNLDVKRRQRFREARGRNTPLGTAGKAASTLIFGLLAR